MVIWGGLSPQSGEIAALARAVHWHDVNGFTRGVQTGSQPAFLGHRGLSLNTPSVVDFAQRPSGLKGDEAPFIAGLSPRVAINRPPDRTFTNHQLSGQRGLPVSKQRKEIANIPSLSRRSPVGMEGGPAGAQRYRRGAVVF